MSAPVRMARRVRLQPTEPVAHLLHLTAEAAAELLTFAAKHDWHVEPEALDVAVECDADQRTFEVVAHATASAP